MNDIEVTSGGGVAAKPAKTYSAADIAADLALAIHQGKIWPGGPLPSQARLREVYNVATGTASAALRKLADAGLARGEPGRGTFPVDRATLARKPSQVLDILAAAALCRSIAAIHWGVDGAVMDIGGDPDYGTDHESESAAPPRRVDVSALAALDRHVARWMSEALYEAARRAVGAGLEPGDTHLMAAVQSILSVGARQPEGQPPIAVSGGPTPDGENVSDRLWPERRNYQPGPDDPPF